jgi:hypothetical protein
VALAAVEAFASGAPTRGEPNLEAATRIAAGSGEQRADRRLALLADEAADALLDEVLLVGTDLDRGVVADQGGDELEVARAERWSVRDCGGSGGGPGREGGPGEAGVRGADRHEASFRA